MIVLVLGLIGSGKTQVIFRNQTESFLVKVKYYEN